MLSCLRASPRACAHALFAACTQLLLPTTQAWATAVSATDGATSVFCSVASAGSLGLLRASAPPELRAAMDQARIRTAITADTHCEHCVGTQNLLAAGPPAGLRIERFAALISRLASIVSQPQSQRSQRPCSRGPPQIGSSFPLIAMKRSWFQRRTG